MKMVRCNQWFRIHHIFNPVAYEYTVARGHSPQLVVAASGLHDWLRRRSWRCIVGLERE